MDSDSKVVEDACLDMVKGGQRQMRYRLKQKYFNGICNISPLAPSIQFTLGIANWSINQLNVDSKNYHTLLYYLLSILFLTGLFDTQDSCMKNKLNREKVWYPQCIGSQSYIAKAYILVRK
jgi:hypothetical protein